MKAIIIILFLTISADSFCFSAHIQENPIRNSSEFERYNNNANLVRAKRHNKFVKSNCVVKLSLSSTGVGAGGGAAAGAEIGGWCRISGSCSWNSCGGAYWWHNRIFWGICGCAATVLGSEPAFCPRSIDEFILNRDLGIIEDDDDQNFNTGLLKLNPNLYTVGLSFHDKTNISAIVKADSSSRYETDNSV